MTPPTFSIDPDAFWNDPYPLLAQMRREAPICFVPELDATLLTKRDPIFECEKHIEVFSSEQPGGLMTVLMGENMMRKDGDAHRRERQQMQTAVSPATVKSSWKAQFEKSTDAVLDALQDRQTCDLVKDYAMPVSAHALRMLTGLTTMTIEEMDGSSQGMIDGIANYRGDKDVEARCHRSTALIDNHIDKMLKPGAGLPESSILAVLCEAGQPMDSVRANVKLAISGGQNEPRDAIAGTVWALLSHPEQLALVLNGQCSWLNAFEEYARWISPIGMSPRRIAKPYTYDGIEFQPDTRAFLMFGSGNRDESVFDKAEQFDLTRNTARSISFGAGPHFCAGAAASRVLIGNVALPKLFERFPKLALDGETPFGGWAFRGPLSMPVRLNR